MDFVVKHCRQYVFMRKFSLLKSFLEIKASFSDVTIITRHASASIGTKLVFDCEGQVISRIPCPREVKYTLTFLLNSNIFNFRLVQQYQFVHYLIAFLFVVPNYVLIQNENSLKH